MSASQRRKGASYEREISNKLRELYPQARRGLSQPRSGCEVPDVEGTPFWVECKHRQRVNLRQALAEADFDALAANKRSELPPLVIARDNGKPDVVVMYFDDFRELLLRARG